MPINNICYYIVILSVTKRYDLHHTFEFYGVYRVYLVPSHTQAHVILLSCVGVYIYIDTLVRNRIYIRYHGGYRMQCGCV